MAISTAGKTFPAHRAYRGAGRPHWRRRASRRSGQALLLAVLLMVFAALLGSTFITIVSSNLNHLTHFFKRVHCITFGAPPVSLLPLKRPENAHTKKSLFYSIINEGDPVVRVAPNEVSASEASAIPKVYPTQKPLAKSDFYPTYRPIGISPRPDTFTNTKALDI